MPHVNDGELHAYLDDALDLLPGDRAEEIREHLRSCEACRSRLAEEKALLERSGEILEGGGPGEMEAPPLEELRERARIREERAAAGAKGGWGTMPRGQALAWAATVVLALGLGWLVRDVGLVRSPMTAPQVEEPGVVEETGAAAAGDAGAGDPGEAGTVRQPVTEEPGRERTRPQAPLAPAEGVPVTGREAAAPAGERAAPAGEKAAPDEERAEERAEAGPSPGATVVGRVVDEASLEPLGGAAVVLEDSAGVTHSGVLTQSDGRFVLRAERPGTYRAVVDLIGYASTRTDFFELSPEETVARDIRAPAQAVALDELTVAGMPAAEADAAEGAAPRAAPESAAAGAAGQAVVGADLAPGAEREALRVRDEAASEGMAATPEAASSHVPGLPVVRIEPQTDPVGFVIVQRLPSGDTLRLRWVAGSAPEDPEDAKARAFPEPLPDGWSEVVVRRGNGWFVARAPLTETELRALLDRPR